MQMSKKINAEDVIKWLSKQPGFEYLADYDMYKLLSIIHIGNIAYKEQNNFQAQHIANSIHSKLSKELSELKISVNNVLDNTKSDINHKEKNK